MCFLLLYSILFSWENNLHQSPSKSALCIINFLNPFFTNFTLFISLRKHIETRHLPLVWYCKILTYVSRQWRVRPWQGGGRTGQDEAFPVTGSATTKHTRTKKEHVNICLHFIKDSTDSRQMIAGTHTQHPVTPGLMNIVFLCLALCILLTLSKCIASNTVTGCVAECVCFLCWLLYVCVCVCQAVM